MDHFNQSELCFRHSTKVSRIEFERDPSRVQSLIHDEMRLSLAEFIRSKKIQKEVRADHVDFMIEVYVATPDQFWSCIQKEARRLALCYGGINPPTTDKESQ